MLVFTGVNVLTMNFGMLEPPQKDSSNIFFLVQALCLRDGINLWQFNLLILYPKTSTISPLPLKLKLSGCYTTPPDQHNQPTYLPTYQPTNPPTNEPANQPTNQLPNSPRCQATYLGSVTKSGWNRDIMKSLSLASIGDRHLKNWRKTPKLPEGNYGWNVWYVLYWNWNCKLKFATAYDKRYSI